MVMVEKRSLITTVDIETAVLEAIPLRCLVRPDVHAAPNEHLPFVVEVTVFTAPWTRYLDSVRVIVAELARDVLRHNPTPAGVVFNVDVVARERR